MNTETTKFKKFRLSRKGGIAVILALLLALSVSLAGCSGGAEHSSAPSGQSSASEISEPSEPESSKESEDSEDSELEAVLSADKLELIKIFANDVYGSGEITELAEAGETERDGVSYKIYTFKNAGGEELRVQLSGDAETSGLIFLCEDVAGEEIVRKIVYGDTAYIGESVSGKAPSDSDLEDYAKELAAALSQDKKVSVEYDGEIIAGGRLMRYYRLSDGTGVAFDDRMNNACACADGQKTSFTAIVKNDEGYALDETKIFKGTAGEETSESN